MSGSSSSVSFPNGRVLCFGSVNIDDVFDVPHIVRTGETLASSGYRMVAGGKGANQSVAASRAGAQTFHAGKIGSDGRWIKEMMQERYGVDCSLLMEDRQQSSGRAIIQVSQENHDNAIILYPGTNHQLTADDVEQVFRDFVGLASPQAPLSPPISARESWLMVQNEINQLDLIVRKASQLGMIIVVNPAPITSDFCRVRCPMDLVNILILNETEAAGLYQQLCAHDNTATTITDSGGNSRDLVGAMEQVLQRLCDHYPDPMCGVIITLGDQGLIAKFRTGPNDEWSPFRVSAYPTTVVDTTGAGDTFIGYFVAIMLEGSAKETMDQNAPLRFDKDLVRRALMTASKGSSLACSRPGAMPSIPSISEVYYMFQI